MNREYTKRLFDFKLLFPVINRSDITKSRMGFGFQISEGWFSLLYALCLDIQSYIIDNPGIPQVEILEVSDGGGYLYIETSGHNDYVEKLIKEAAIKSTMICSVCGGSDDIKCCTQWTNVVCEECIEKDARLAARAWELL